MKETDLTAATTALGRADGTRRRAQRALRTAAALLAAGAPPATTAELARWTGVSRDKILADLDAGLLQAAWPTRRKGSKVLFPAVFAVRYLKQMGVLSADA